ncbi:MAG: C40 family peptidase [Pseudonocardia sp.]|uniref:NlpC/P60 family protein n=1 Tax=Pseudonocardia sp. TaxID=60912 RepID=UPI001AC48555|nr:NlpC/P60 family protein [Pseudonocardia sp.]MBN9100374.1 C40 family peptidase [Pseudonocardia sp.]
MSGSSLAVVALVAGVLIVNPASADPPPPVDPAAAAAALAAPATTPAPPPRPTNATDAAAQLDQVQREAEALTEQWHAAQDALTARQQDVTNFQNAVGPAKAAVDVAKANEESYRKQVDAVAMATFESGNLDQFNALLASGSPQDFLDQMSALESLSSQYKEALGQLSAEVDKTTAAQSDADAAVARAQAAVAQATKAEQDLGARKKDAEMRIDEAEKLLAQLSPQQRRDRNGPGADAPDITGSGVGVEALRAAATQLGKPYVWGAEGPNSYDCSGLTSWAFKKAGVTLPRSSSQQALVGRAVSWDQLQPGDLVFYYSPVSHVGIYAGNGTFIDAPQSGDVVKYQKVSRSAFTGARRV